MGNGTGWVRLVLKYKKGSSMAQADALSRRQDHPGEIDNDNKEQVLLPPHLFKDHMKANLLSFKNEITNFRVQTMARWTISTIRDVFIEDMKKSNTNFDQKVKKVLEDTCHASGQAQDGSCWRQEAGLTLKDESIVVLRDQEIQWRIISAHHNTITAGHPSISKTKELIQWNYYWVDMHNDIKKYVEGCLVCYTIKPIWELNPTKIPNQPWDTITMDFIGPLLESWGNNMILKVVDWHSKILYSLPCNDIINMEGVTQLFQKKSCHIKGCQKMW